MIINNSSLVRLSFLYTEAEKAMIPYLQGVSGVTSGKQPAPANAGDRRDVGLIGRSPGEGNGNPLQYSCRGQRIPWTEETGGLQSSGSQRVRHN